jgi:hypothetical protein
MTHGFPELVIGDVLVAPFVTYAIAALLLVILFRPVLQLIKFETRFNNPALALLCVYVTTLAALIVLL